MNKNYSYQAQRLHEGAMNWAKGARGATKKENIEIAGKMYTWALEKELKALDMLLSEEVVDEPTVVLFSKYAAAYALELGETDKARQLLDRALTMNAEPRLRDEISRLLADVQANS